MIYNHVMDVSGWLEIGLVLGVSIKILLSVEWKGTRFCFISKRKINYKHHGKVTNSRTAHFRNSSRNAKKHTSLQSRTEPPGMNEKIAEYGRAMKGGGEQAKPNTLHAHYDSLKMPPKTAVFCRHLT